MREKRINKQTGKRTGSQMRVSIRETAGGIVGEGFCFVQLGREPLTEILALGQRSVGSQGESKVASRRRAPR